MKKKRKNIYYPYGVNDEIEPKSNSREDIIEWIFKTHIIEFYTTYLLKKTIEDNPDVEDKIQELYLMVCELPDEKLKDLFEQGKHSILAYVTGVVHQQLITTNSKIYRKYEQRKKKEITKDEIFWETYDEEE